jgi:hypothetical protein
MARRRAHWPWWWGRPAKTMMAALMAQLQANPSWLEPVLRALPAAKVPVVQAMPLVQAAMPLGLVTPVVGQALMRDLIAAGYWVDAHAIWMHLWNRPLGWLFNADFEQDFVRDSFDWQVTDLKTHRAGAKVQQPRLGTQGRVLELVFTGRALAQPIVGQRLVLPPGEYRFSGQYMSRGFRSEKGLAWVFVCASSGLELVRTPGLQDTSGRWENFSTSLSVPAACGVGVHLKLQPELGDETRKGLRGDVWFDQFELVSTERRP